MQFRKNFYAKLIDNINLLTLSFIIIFDLKSEALSVNNGGTSFLIFLFGDPQGLEG